MTIKITNNMLCYFMILIIPFSWVNTIFGSLFRIAAIVCFFVWCIQNKLVLRISNEKKSLFLLWTVYVIYACITYLWSITKEESIDIVYGMVLLYMISIIFFSSFYDENVRKRFDHCWIIVTISLIFMFMFGGYQQVQFSSRQTLIILGTPTDANEFGSFFIVGAAICIRYILYEERVLLKFIYIVTLVASFYVVLMTGSRGALISLLAAVFLTMLQELSLKTVLKLLLCFIVCGVLMYILVIPNIPEANLNRLMLSSLISDGGSGRDEIWLSAWNSFLNSDVFHMMFGNGYGRFEIYGHGKKIMHNQFLQQLISYGIVGLVLYLSLLLKCAKIYMTRLDNYKGAFWGVIIMSMTITMGPSYKLLWFMYFIAMMSEKYKENKYEDL